MQNHFNWHNEIKTLIKQKNNAALNLRRMKIEMRSDALKKKSICVRSSTVIIKVDFTFWRKCWGNSRLCWRKINRGESNQAGFVIIRCRKIEMMGKRHTERLLFRIPFGWIQENTLNSRSQTEMRPTFDISCEYNWQNKLNKIRVERKRQQQYWRIEWPIHTDIQRSHTITKKRWETI